MSRPFFPTILVAAMVIAVFSFRVHAMPPHPDLAQRIQNGVVTMPYYLQREDELRTAGVEAPNRIPYLENLVRRHNLDQNFNALVILVDFSDHHSHVAASSFDQLLFGPQTGSLSNYVSQETYGSLTLVTVNLPGALGWTRLPQTYAYYDNGQNGMGSYPHNSQKMVEDAVALVDPVVNFVNYDNDGDGYVDALFVLHSGPGAEFTGNNNDIWSHAWGTPTPINVDGVHVWNYSTEPEYWQAPGDMTCGVYAHEMGHAAFGLPDLYDTDYNSSGVGTWSLMSFGSWNGTLGNSPALPDAWCKIQMGVVNPTTIVANTLGVSIPAVEFSPTVYRLGDPGPEYFLVENRQQSGYDVGLPGNGLLIWHIDESQYSNNNQWYPGHTTSGHFKVALEQSDALWELEHNSNRGNAGDPYPGSGNHRTFDDASTPNSRNYASATTGVAVRNISTSGSTMAADLYTSSPRTLTVAVPNGGVTWYGGDADTIRWTSSNITGNVKIEYNASYPSIVWNTIVASAANTGWYRWTVPGYIIPSTRVRVSSVSYPAVADTSDANFSLDIRTISVSSPALAQIWIAGDVDTIRWTSQNLNENVRIEINRSYPTGSWTVLAASTPNTGSYAWTVNRSASNSARIRVKGVTHTAVVGMSNTFYVVLRTITVLTPNTAITWVVGDSTSVYWTSANVPGEPVTISLNRHYPSAMWEILASSTPNDGAFNLMPAGPLTSTARVRVVGTIHTNVGDTSNVNFSIGQRSIHVTFPNTATTCLVGGPDTIRWTSTCMTNEGVNIQIDRNFPSGSWEPLGTNILNLGWFRWMVNGPAAANARIRVTATGHPLIGDTSDVSFSVAVPSIALAAPDGGEIWYVGDADTIRWASQNLTENVKIEVNRAFPTGSWTTLASGTANTGWYRWVVTSGNSTAARVRISAVSHTFVRDSSSWAFSIAARTITVTSPTTAVTWLTGDINPITWTSQNLPDDSVKIEINRTYSTGTWSLIARVPNIGYYSWVVTTPTSTSSRIRITGLRHTAISGVSATNFTIGTRRFTVTSPNTAVTWILGDSYNITWTSACMPEAVKIELNRSYPSAAWETIIDSTANDGTHPWIVTAPLTTTARIRVTGLIHTNVRDTSNTNFSVGRRSITVTKPNTSLTWIVGRVDTVCWTYSNLSENVKIELNRSYPSGPWEVLAASVTNSGSYRWTIAGAATTTARIRVSGITHTTVGDTSDVNFSIQAEGMPPAPGGDGTLFSTNRASGLPTEFALWQNYPNPFNPSTEIRFDLPEAAQVELRVFNLYGQRVTTLVSEMREAGSYRETWDGRSASGAPEASGVYILQLRAGNFTSARKMLLTR